LRGDENYWILESYQRRSGRVEAFFQHILQAYVYNYSMASEILNIVFRAELSLEDERSLVIFSGYALNTINYTP